MISDFGFEVGEIIVNFGDADFEVDPDGDKSDDEDGNTDRLWHVHGDERGPGVHGLYFSGDILAFMLMF